MQTFRRVARAGLVAGMLVSVSACAVRSPSIGDIRYNPGRYYNRTVTVEGTVSSAWGVPLVPFQIFKITDPTGELTVVSQERRVPPKGARVRVRGRVEELGAFGGRSIGTHIRETDLKVLGW
jgi:hypothetical protein